MVVVSLCRPGPAWRTPTNSKLFPFRMAVVSLCRPGPAWRTPTNNKFFPFRMAVVSLCRLGAAGGHRRTANFTHFVWLWLACATLEHRKEHRRSTNFFHPVGLYNKKASCDPKNREATRKPFLSNQCNCCLASNNPSANSSPTKLTDPPLHLITAANQSHNFQVPQSSPFEPLHS